MTKSSYIPPSYLVGLINSGFNQDLARLLAKQIPPIAIFESCARNEITPKQGAELMQIQDQSNYWICRVIYDFWRFVWY